MSPDHPVSLSETPLDNNNRQKCYLNSVLTRIVGSNWQIPPIPSKYNHLNKSCFKPACPNASNHRKSASYMSKASRHDGIRQTFQSLTLFSTRSDNHTVYQKRCR